jgi:hypothetical protein
MLVKLGIMAIATVDYKVCYYWLNFAISHLLLHWLSYQIGSEHAALNWSKITSLLEL